MKKLNLFLMSVALMSTMGVNAEDAKKGFDETNLDKSVVAADDFFDYACGGWMKKNPLQPQYSRYGQFDAMAENNKEQLKELIQNLGKQQNAQGSIAQKVNDLYLLGLDSVRLNKEGNAPILPVLKKINDTKKADYMGLISWMHYETSASPFFGLGVEADLMNSNQNMIYLGQSGMGLGDRDYYLENDANTAKIRNAYVKYVEKLFELSGYKSGAAKKAAKNVMKVETELAKAAMTRVEQRDIAKQYNVRTFEQLKADYPNIDWNVYFNNMGLTDVKKVNVSQLKTMEEVNKMMKTLSDKEMVDYLSFCYINSAASFLSDDFVQAEFDMYGKVMSGKKEMQPRWKRALSVPNGLLGEAVGQLYVEKYFAGESKTKMLKLVENLKRSLAEHIASLPWMSDKTKVNALVKLNSFTVKIGYPDKWRDYSHIAIDAKDSYWTNVSKAIESESKYQLAKYNKPVDKTEWGMSPQTVNAYYNPTTNEICFPAGILQAPYFDVNADDAANYGAIGVVIGHEMTHGFDDQGRQFDQNGNMVDWWTAEDAAKFKVLTDKLVDQFNNIEVAEGVKANGRFTLGENIADQGGLRVAYTAFKKAQEETPAQDLYGFTPDQRFYLAYANVWAGNITKQEILRRTKEDPHSLGRWRVNATLRNIDDFIKAFNVTDKNKMFIPEGERVIIW